MKNPRPQRGVPKKTAKRHVLTGPTEAQTRAILGAIESPFQRSLPPKALNILRNGSATFSDCKERVCKHGGAEAFILNISAKDVPEWAVFEVDAKGMAIQGSERMAYHTKYISRLNEDQKIRLKNALGQIHAVYSQWKEPQ